MSEQGPKTGGGSPPRWPERPGAPPSVEGGPPSPEIGTLVARAPAAADPRAMKTLLSNEDPRKLRAPAAPAGPEGTVMLQPGVGVAADSPEGTLILQPGMQVQVGADAPDGTLILQPGMGMAAPRPPEPTAFARSGSQPSFSPEPARARPSVPPDAMPGMYARPASDAPPATGPARARPSSVPPPAGAPLPGWGGQAQLYAQPPLVQQAPLDLPPMSGPMSLPTPRPAAGMPPTGRGARQSQWPGTAPMIAPAVQPTPRSVHPSAPVPAAQPSAVAGDDDHPPVSSDGGPSPFSRMFLAGLDRYQQASGEVGSATEEAVARLAQSTEAERPVVGKTLRLRSPLALVEAVLLTLLIPGIGYVLDRSDPFFLQRRFSWLCFAPLLLGLRHGFSPALVSAIALDVLIAAAWRKQFVPMPKLPGDTMLGLAAIAMLTGQFSDVWKREIVRLDRAFELLRKQQNQLVRTNFLLALSTDRLRERVGRGTPSLRDALLAVQRVAEASPSAKLVDVADQIMDTFATFTLVEVGALYMVQGGVPSAQPIASVGRPGALDTNDPLLKAALRSRKLTYIPTSSAQDAAKTTSKLLAVVPLVDALGELHGVLCVESIPLLAFEARNLEALATLGCHFADMFGGGLKDASLERGQRKEFEIRVRRALRDVAQNGVQSTVFGLVIRQGSAVSDSIESVLGGALRALDFPFVQRDEAGNYCIYILLPVTDEAGARALGARIERLVRRELNMPLARAGAFHFFHALDPQATVDNVMRALEGKAKLDEAAVEHTIFV